MEEAVRIMSDIGEGGRYLAGGQTLLVLMKMRIDDPTDIVDLGRIPDADDLQDADDTIAIGALATHRRIGESRIAADIPIVADCANGIADNQVRSRGTIGGSLASGDPSCDWPALLHALDAQVVCVGPNGERTLDINGFVEDLYQTVLQPGEIVREVRFPRPAAASGGAYCAFKRCAPAYPTVSTGVQLTLDGGRIGDCRIVFGSAGLTPIRAQDAEKELTGQDAKKPALDKMVEAALAAIDPLDDQRGSAAFKRQLARALVKRATLIALRRAGGATVKNSHEYY